MNQMDQQIKNMRKLKIYGVKDLSGGYPEILKRQELIATVFVAANKKIIVEAIDQKVEKDLLDAIYWQGKGEVPVFRIKGGAPTEALRKIEEEERKQKKFTTWVANVRPGDPLFLEGLMDKFRQIKPIDNGWKILGDYYNSRSIIVQE